MTVHKLPGNAAFEVVANGVTVGTLQTNRHGAGRVHLRSRPHGHTLLLGFDPRGAQLAIRDANGQDVLVAMMPDRRHDPSAIACCLSARHAGGCEEWDQAACVRMGGAIANTASCLPNPCGGPSSGGDDLDDVVCCMPDSATGAFDDHHAAMGCADHRGIAMCAMQGGTAVTAASCAVHQCGPTLPPPDATVCCVPEDHGMECRILTATQCGARSGTATTATVCRADACGAPPPSGDATACCIRTHRDMHGGAECEVLSVDACTARGGTPSNAAACSPATCGHMGGGMGGDGPGHGAF